METQALLAQLKESGAQAELYSGSFDSLEVRFTAGEIKNATAREASGLAVRAIKDGKQGFVGSRDTSAEGLERLKGFVQNSIAVGDAARFSFPTPAEAPVDPASLKTYDEGVQKLGVQELLEVGKQAIAALKQRHPDVNIDGGVKRSFGKTRLESSEGIAIDDAHSTYSVFFEVNRTQDEDVLLDYAYEVGVSPSTVDAQRVVDELAERLDWAKETVSLEPGRMPVLFTPAGSMVVWSPLLSGLSGKTVMVGTSPLRERVGETILDARVQVTDDGLLPGGLSTAAFDDEGIPRQTRTLIEDGVLKGFVHDLETAKATGSEPTGNGERGGVTGKPGPGFSNVLIRPGDTPLKELMGGIKKGLLVHSVIGMGQGNTLPGTFSNPIDLAYLIEDGEVKGRVKDVSIAGNIYELLKDNLGGLSAETKVLSGTMHLPWLLLNDMNVVGKA